MVLDSIICATVEDLGDLSPLVAHASMIEVEEELLLQAPCDLLDVGIQMVVPSLSTLLSNPPRKLLGDLSPFLGAVQLDELKDKQVLFLCPGTLHETWI